MGQKRGIDKLVQFILDVPYLSEVDKQIIIARLYIEPSEGEYAQARARAQIGRNASQ